MDKAQWRFYGAMGGLFGLLILITLTSTFLSRGGTVASQETLSNRSVYNNGETGYKAWQSTLSRAHVSTRIWRQDFSQLPPSPDAVMLIVEPYAVAGQEVVFAKEQIGQLMRWVHQGHTAILLDDFQRYRELGSRQALEKLGIGRIRASIDPSKNRRLRWTPQTDPLYQTFVDQPLRSRIPATLHIAGSPYKITPLLKNGDGLYVLVAVQYGQGTLILGTVPDIAANRHLQDAGLDNYQFLANLVGRQGSTLYINEYVHGYKEIDDLLSYYRAKLPLEQLALQLTLVVLAVLWLSALPRGRQREGSESPPSVNPLTFLGAMAGIYERSQVAELTLRPQLRQLEQLLRRYYRIGLTDRQRLGDLLKSRAPAYSEEAPGPADERSIAEALKRLDEAEHAVKTGKRLPPNEVLRLSRQLSWIQERLFDGHPGPADRARRKLTRPSHPGHRG